jgi:protein-disulfide isomerase
MVWKKISQLTKSENFITVLFITCSLGAFILASVFYFLFILWARPAVAPTKESVVENQFVSPDPLITKIPDLKDLIKKPLLTEADPSLGPKDAPIKVVIFSDFTCQFCLQEEKIINDLLAAYPDKIQLIRKDYPDGKENSAAWQAALAGRCANEQNSFWPMHDQLFSVKAINEAAVTSAAKKVNLNQGRFKSCLAADSTKRLIRDNIEEANALNINGVPFIFVNDIEFMGETDFAELKIAVEAELSNIKK